jgi:predicted DNA-binding protein (UPF0251 family)
MPRPTSLRNVQGRLAVRGFKPMGVPCRERAFLVLAEDELEAIRLADLEGLYQEEAADRMGVSRPTYGRILSRGRAVLAKALCEGRPLLIGRGPVTVAPRAADSCPVHGGPRRRGRTCRCAADDPAEPG